MIRQHSPVPLIMPGPLLLSLLGMAFCVWSASGNALNFCFSTGCSLYQDVSVGGVSMWWLGCFAFSVLALLSLSGRPWLGVMVAGLCLIADTALLVLMLMTAPCVGCLFVALIFALVYVAFRHSGAGQGEVRRSLLVLLWIVLFIGNLGSLLRAEAGVWSMHGPEDATVRVYFSPSCSACREAVNSLSGRVNVGFYPVAENEDDVYAIASMVRDVNAGDNMAEALAKAKGPEATSFLQGYTPEMLFLRFRLLRNKSHVLGAGSQSVPFIEYHGLPSGLVQKKKDSASYAKPAPAPAPASQDPTLPIDTDIAGSCGGPTSAPCP